MAKRLFQTQGLSFTAITTGATASTNAYMTLVATVAGQLCDVLEVLISGMASASTLGGFVLGRASTLGTGGASALSGATASDGFCYPSGTTLGTNMTVAIAYATTQPVSSSATSDARINLSLNGFGGILRWNAAPTQQYQIVGSSAPGASAILYNSSSGGGVTCAANAHFEYEPY